jgi:hypothetical protein
MSEPLTTAATDGSAGLPFPWFCPRCRRKAVRRETIRYECSRSHNGQPLTVVVEYLKVPRCGHCGELVFDYDAEEQINRAFRDPLQGGAGAGTGVVQPDRT